jgi:hypothetical protein
MCRLLRIYKTERLSHVNCLLEITIQESIVDIKLSNLPHVDDC